ncbi:MAG TPA: transposase [Phycisphaerae bacterium]|nr:transposase [Phycisphaerae bacterium]
MLAMNGPADHVHFLGILHPKHAFSDLFRDVKAITSNWIHESFPAMQNFAWQAGYSAFSVSQSQLGAVKSYIARQEEHHRKRSFEEELVALLEKHGLEYDRKYVFD